MNREVLLESLKTGGTFDILVVGGGATGCGVALDAASRGLRVALVERGDFSCGTSSRSTKLVHGGVRYLEAALLHLDRVQFNLVRDALRERAVLLRNAPHLCRAVPLITPLYKSSEVPYILAGLKLYDLLAGKAGIGRSRLLGRDETLRLFPMVKAEGLKAGVLYYDGQFNDARMNVALALTAIQEGAVAVNYVEATGLILDRGRVAGARVRERVGGSSFEIRARCVVNAAGPYSDQIRFLEDPGTEPMLSVSSGVHIVLTRRFTPPQAGITIPRTEDGRVLFVLPWQGRCLVGTTDNPAVLSEHPEVDKKEIDYLLRHLRRYFAIEVEPADVAAAWSGLRPLVRDPAKSDTARLARDHVVNISSGGLITVTGGKWTTYRKMAQDTVDRAVDAAGLKPGRECQTLGLVLHGARGYRPDGVRLLSEKGVEEATAAHLNAFYGDQAEAVADLCRGALGERLAADYPYLKGEVLYAARHEMAVTAADFLIRRIPLALLDRKAAREAARAVLQIMSEELGWDQGRVAREREELSLRLDRAL